MGSPGSSGSGTPTQHEPRCTRWRRGRRTCAMRTGGRRRIFMRAWKTTSWLATASSAGAGTALETHPVC
eukprot:13844174-Alexandrium_andersonii.AAC.1